MQLFNQVILWRRGHEHVILSIYTSVRLTSVIGQVGWPMAVATSERQDFIGAVHQKKQEILKQLLREGEVPLRDGKHFHLPHILDHVFPLQELG